jgi:hypothetical protein
MGNIDIPNNSMAAPAYFGNPLQPLAKPYRAF